MDFPVGSEDHKDHSADADSNSDPHFHCEGFTEQEGSYQDCRQGLKDPEDRCLRGTDLSGGYRKCKQGDHRRDNGKADQVAPVGGSVDPFSDTSSLEGTDGCEKKCPCQQRIQS